MFEFLFSVLFSFNAIIALAIVAFLFEYNNSTGWCSFLVILLVVVIKFTYSIAWVDFGLFVLFYVPIGLFWSIIRWYRYCRNEVQKYKSGASGYSYDLLHRRLQPSKNISDLSGWVIAWPFSFLNLALGDVIFIIETALKRYFVGIYNSIANKALSSIEKP